MAGTLKEVWNRSKNKNKKRNGNLDEDTREEDPNKD